jgi:hypothetical protein
MAQGTGTTGLQKAAGTYAGKGYVSDVQKAIRTGNEGGKYEASRAGASGWAHPLNTVRNFSHAMAETATNLSEGLRDAKVLQSAYDQGKKMGMKGDELDIYAHTTAVNPSKQILAKGEQLVKEVNNMNDNPLTNGLEGLAKSFDKVPVVGDTIRNLISPFNRWVGGMAWNGITDKNAIANVIKAGMAWKKGDPQEVMHQLAGLATNTFGAMGAGYALAQSGHLTTTNAEGYNDNGLYLHFGSHYIPVGDFLGFTAPGVIMGWATHSAMTDNTPGKSMVQKIAENAGKAFTATATAYMRNTTVGGSNNLLTETQAAIQQKPGHGWGEVAPAAAGDAAGNYVPGIFGDINSAINTYNIGGLNPTHEAGLTKVTKGINGEVTSNGLPSKAKDALGTAVNQVINRVPVASQTMIPRNPGVQAPDPWSRIFRGDNESPQQAKDNNAINALPTDLQAPVRKSLQANSGANIVLAQAAADNMKPGPNKVAAQQNADKLKFQSGQDVVKNATEQAQLAKAKTDFAKSNSSGIQKVGNQYGVMVDGKPTYFDNQDKAQAAVDMKQAQDSGKDTVVVNNKTYVKDNNGNYKPYENPLQAQQAKDNNDFQSGKRKDFGVNVNGKVYQKGSDGKITSMDTKDHDYKTAMDDIKSAKQNGDMNGIQTGQQKLLDNIQWQLNHADLTDENRKNLIDTAAATQAEYNKYKLWGDTTKPKGAPDYQMDFGGGNPKSSNYIKAIKESGVKYGLDTSALLAVAAAEGLGGTVGDGGHAFGPFQMNDAGGVLTGRFKSPQEAQAYAESPQGIEEAVKNIAAAAKGKIGPDAIAEIVANYEKPADYLAGLQAGLSPIEAAKQTRDYKVATAAYEGTNKVVLPTNPDGVVTGSSGDTSLVADPNAALNAANLVRQNKVGNVPQMSNLDFTDKLSAKPIPVNIPQIKLTPSNQLIKAHKITVGMPRA